MKKNKKKNNLNHTDAAKNKENKKIYDYEATEDKNNKKNNKKDNQKKNKENKLEKKNSGIDFNIEDEIDAAIKDIDLSNDEELEINNDIIDEPDEEDYETPIEDTAEEEIQDEEDNYQMEKDKSETIIDEEPTKEFDEIIDDDNQEKSEDESDFVKTDEEEKPKKKNIFAKFKKNKDKKELPIDNNNELDDEFTIKDSDNQKKKEKKKLFGFKAKKNKPIIIDSNNESKKEKKKRNKEDKKDKKKKKKRSFWKILLTWILIFGIIGVISVAAFLGYIVATAPKFSNDALVIKDQTVIYDINGNIIAKLGTEKRESVSYDALPQVLIDAIIATEDSRFFQHNGVDLFRFVKATALQLIGRDEAGGASTLTMQTVKNNLTKKDSVESTASIQAKIKKVIRKFQDVYLAVFKVEKEYSKEEILEIYVNDNFLGGSYYGVEEASKYYFGKSVSEISLPEAALIAGLFQAPGRHNPYKDIESATKRRSTVLTLMERHGYITKEEKELAESIPIESLLVGQSSDKTPYQGYIDAVIEEVERLTDRGDGTGGDDPATVPMKIYTTMEKSIQDGINKLLNDNEANYWKDDKATAGIAIVNVNTGAIAAVGAGRNKQGERLFNNATQAKRQPGSTAKPLFDYGPAIEYNNYSSGQLYNDEPWTYTGGVNVNNWDNRYGGLMTMRYALQVSRNIPALKTFQQVGAKNSQKFAYSLGLDVSLNSSSENYRTLSSGIDNTINEAYSIGGVAEGFSPLEMASAYSGFASGGYYTSPYSVTKIIYRETGEEKEYKHPRERVMKDSTAYIMNNILESATTNGFHGGARVGGSHVAVKTGTTNYDEATRKKYNIPSSASNDIWTIAYTSQYSIALWYGYENIKDGYNINNVHKELLMSKIMNYIPKDTKGWSMPSSVVAVTIEKNTTPAKLPSEFTPGDMKLTEYFVRGTQPTEVSERYQKFNAISADTIKQTDKTANSVTITWDYKTPNAVSEDYLKNYFTNSVYGKQGTKYYNERIEYNNNTLGGFGYGIYKKEADGTLTLLEFVKDKTYTYKGYGSTTLVIKAEYGKWKNNASNGTEVKITLDEYKPPELVVGITNDNAEYQTGSFKEDGIKSIKFGELEIKDSVSIKYQIKVDGTINEFAKAENLENFVNTLSAGNYTIIYNITYLTNEIKQSRSITLK